MKDLLRKSVVVAFVGSIVPACGGKGGGGGGGSGTPPPATNQFPGASLVRPAPGETFSPGFSITIEAQVSDGDGWVSRVDFLDGATMLGAVFAWPFRLTWNGAAQGTHSLLAVATDNAGASTTSAPVSITVGTPGNQPPTVIPEGLLRGVCFADASRGWIVGEPGRIYATTNGGDTWIVQNSGTTAMLNRVQFVSTTLGWAVGDAGTILRTSDGGANWSRLISGTTATLSGLSFVDANTGWTAGAEGVILKTTDGGTTWTVQSSGTTEGLGAVSFASTMKGWIGGFGVILTTIDGGASWSSQSTEYTSQSGFPATGYFIDARFMSETRGTMVGNSRTGDVLWTTTDGGATWDRNYTSPPPYTMFGVAFGDASFLCSVGTWGNIATSSDGGLTWTLRSSPTPETLRGVWFVNGTTGWAVGENGVVLRTSDAGATWVVLNGGT